MGILVGDSKNFFGLILQNWVMSVKGGCTRISKIVNQEGEITYQILYDVYYWVSQTAYNESSPWLRSEARSLTASPSQIAGDIFALIYGDLAAGYTEVTNI